MIDSALSSCHSNIPDISAITYIRKKLLLDSVGAFLCLPPTRMNSFGITDCFLSDFVVFVETPNCNFHVDTERAGHALIGTNELLRLIPTVLDFLLISTFVFTLLVWVLPGLEDKEVMPQLLPSKKVFARQLLLPILWESESFCGAHLCQLSLGNLRNGLTRTRLCVMLKRFLGELASWHQPNCTREEVTVRITASLRGYSHVQVQITVHLPSK